MKKSLLTLMLIITAVMLCGAVFLLVANNRKGGKSTWSHVVTVKNGKADPGGSTMVFTVQEEGEHTLALSWNLAGEGEDLTKASEDGGIGFITGIAMTDPEGNEVYGTSAAAVFLDTKLQLKPGNYTIEFTYLTNEDDYIAYAKKHLCGEMMAETLAKDLNFGSRGMDGSWQMEYTSRVSPAANGITQVIPALLAILLAVCVSIILLVAFTRGKKTLRQEYDERQELARGRAFRYAFYSMLIFIGGVLCFDWTGLIPGQNQMIFYASGLFFGILVYAVYCVWNDCYFALNQRTNIMIVFFTFIGLFNLAIAVTGIIRGTMIQNGRFSEQFLNLECAFLFLALMVTLVIKKIHDRRLTEDEE